MQQTRRPGAIAQGKDVIPKERKDKNLSPNGGLIRHVALIPGSSKKRVISSIAFAPPLSTSLIVKVGNKSEDSLSEEHITAI
jgi:hypothetical protein